MRVAAGGRGARPRGARPPPGRVVAGPGARHGGRGPARRGETRTQLRGARRRGLVVPLLVRRSGVRRRTLRALLRGAGDRHRRLAERPPARTPRVDVHPAPPRGRPSRGGQRAVPALRCADAPAVGPAGAPALEVPLGLPTEPALVPDHPARPPVGLDGDAGARRAVAVGATRARRGRPAEGAPRARSLRGGTRWHRHSRAALARADRSRGRGAPGGRDHRERPDPEGPGRRGAAGRGSPRAGRAVVAPHSRDPDPLPGHRPIRRRARRAR